MASPFTTVKGDEFTRLTPAGIIRCLQVQDPLSHRGSIVLEAIVFSISRATLPLVQRRSHWADEGEVIKRRPHRIKW